MTITNIRRLSCLFALGGLATNAHASVCSAPPYGDTESAYHAYAESLGVLGVRIDPQFLPTQILPKVCRAKFEGADRTPFFNAGLTDKDFSEKSVTELAVEWIVAVRHIVQQLPE